MKRKVFFFCILAALTILGTSLGGPGDVITPTGDATTLVNTILGPGITIVGTPVYTGSPIASGTFTFAAPAAIGLESGIILTSGDATHALGPNQNAWELETIGSQNPGPDDSTALGLPGDSDLNVLSGYTTYDASVLEFDFQNDHKGDLTFRFVFASEEYLDYVNTVFNDVFGFFVDGINIGVVPGTGDPITVNKINPLLNNAYYKNNINPVQYDLEYDGFTAVLTAQFLDLEPGIHHMKLAIADTSDQILDAAVFIEAGSFTFAEIEVPFDVRPGSCPNPFNLASNGVVPVAILGTADLDVTLIDPASFVLNGDPLSPLDPMIPIRWAYEDVATPYEPYMGKTSCEDCVNAGPDGYLDLTLKIDAEIVAAWLGAYQDGDCVRLSLSGETFDGVPIVGEDFIVLRIKK